MKSKKTNNQKKQSGIKNYTTSITVEKTIFEIENMLAKFGATHIYKIYEDTIPKGLAFTLVVDNMPVLFKLPMRERNILVVFNKQATRGLLPKKYINDIEQARRTGWRIIKDWVDSQIALISIDVARPEEIFLPYMYNSNNDETFFEQIQKKGFDNLLEDKR